MAICHIYKITNLITNEVYIGKTRQSLETRFKKHCVSSDCPSLHEAILDYGRKNFKIELLEECEEENSSEIESKYIKQYDSIKKGYNNTYSVSGYRTEEETKIISQEKQLKENILHQRIQTILLILLTLSQLRNILKHIKMKFFQMSVFSNAEVVE